MKQIINCLFIVLGFISLALAFIGIALPLIPATPFAILTAICFAKGSKRFHLWFTKTKIYKNYVKDVITDKTMTAKAKKKVLITLTLVFIIGFLVSPIWHAKVVILLVAIFHYYYFLVRIKTKERRTKQCFTND